MEIMKGVADNSVDLILCDLPYGTTKNEWDKIIPIDKLWEQYRRIIKDRGIIALFAQAPFDYTLVGSNMEMFKYEWIWVKPNGSNFLNCNYAPMKVHEKILIFSKSPCSMVKDSVSSVYNPQMREGTPYKVSSGSTSSNYSTYKSVTTVSDGSRYPIDVLYYNKDKTKYHPTQKPVDLCDYLIRTYTDEGMLVLDNCMGSGSTGVAAVTLNRDFIGIEIDPKYFKIAEKRISDIDSGMDLLDLNSCI